MKHEEKKKIAEFMGVASEGHYIFTYRPDDYNPDTNPEQFREVLGNLTPEQRSEVEIILANEMPRAIHILEDFLWISDPKNMPKVMDAVLEVINEKAD